jgi:hypothetical protein
MTIRSAAAALARSPKAIVAIGYMFATNLDSIIVIPLLPILHGGPAGAIARDVALALSLRLGASLGMSLMVPLAFGRLGNGAMLLMASIMKAAAAVTLVLAPAPESLFAFALLAGAGTGALRPAVRAVIAEDTRGPEQALAFQLLFLAMNVAFVLGPIMADLAAGTHLVVPAVLMAAALEMAAGLAASRLVASGVPSPRPAWAAPQPGGAPIAGDRFLLLLYVLLAHCAVGFVISALVLYESIDPAIGAWRNYLLSVEGFAVIAVQLGLMPVFGRLGRPAAYAAVAAASAAGMALCFSGVLWLSFAGLFVFAAAECLAMPIAQIALCEAAAPGARRLLFSLSMVTASIGEIAGTWLSWAATRADAVGLSGLAAGQAFGLGFGVLFGLIGLALTRQSAPAERRPLPVSRQFAD